MKKTLSLVVALSMIFSLCACGSKPSNSTVTSNNSTSASSSNTTAPEYVYKSEFKTLAENTRVNYNPQCYLDNGIYADGYEVVGSSAPEGVEEEYFGQYDITEPRLYFIEYSGKINKLPNYSPVPKIEAAEGQYDYLCNSFISGLSVKPNGNLAVIEVLSISYMDEENVTWDREDWSEHYHYETLYYLRELDSTGAEIASTTINVNNNDYLYCQGTIDRDGNFLASKSTEGGEYSILAISPEGEEVYEIPCENYVENIFSFSDGQVYVVMWSNNLELYPIDFNTHKLGTPVSLPQDAYTIYTGGGDYQLYYTSGVNFYGMNIGDESPTKLFNWMDCDVHSDTVWKVGISSDGEIRTLVSEFDNTDMVYDISLVDINKVPYDPSTAKQVLTLAVQYLDWELQSSIIEFNRKHNDVKIEVIDYSEYNTPEDYSAGTTKMTTEIIAGNTPDIIYLSGMPTSQFAAKGILEDLYPYIEADKEINMSDYYENVIKAAEYNGKLVKTVTYFSLYTVAGASSLVGDLPGWTFKDFNLALSELQSNVDGATAFDASTTRADILNTCLCLDMDDFVNWNTGKVDFNNEEFYSLLEFANSFPSTYDWDNYNYQTDSTEMRLSQGKQLLWRDYLSSTDALMYLESCFKGTDVTFVGYPTNNGVGNMIYLDDGFAMTTSCTNKEAAWDFLRQMFTAKYYNQHYSYYGLSPIKSVLEKSLKDAQTVKYQISSDGQYVLDENGDRIPEPRYFAINTDLYQYYALSQKTADAFIDAVESCNKVYNYNQSIISIVEEEAEAYFQGQKSVQEVSKLIQSKANIYVNEQR